MDVVEGDHVRRITGVVRRGPRNDAPLTELAAHDDPEVVDERRSGALGSPSMQPSSLVEPAWPAGASSTAPLPQSTPAGQRVSVSSS